MLPVSAPAGKICRELWLTSQEPYILRTRQIEKLVVRVCPYKNLLLFFWD